MLLYALLILIAVGVLLISEPGQALLAWLLKTTIHIAVIAIIAVITILLIMSVWWGIGAIKDWGNSETGADTLDVLGTVFAWLGTVFGIFIFGFVIYRLLQELWEDLKKGTNKTKTIVFGAASPQSLWHLRTRHGEAAAHRQGKGLVTLFTEDTFCLESTHGWFAESAG